MKNRRYNQKRRVRVRIIFGRKQEVTVNIKSLIGTLNIKSNDDTKDVCDKIREALIDATLQIG